MAGTGKRADHRKTFILNLKEKYFGKNKALRKKIKKKLESINIQQIIDNLELFIKTKKAEKIKDTVNINLNGYKILGLVENIPLKLVITASAASKSAIDKIKKAGGDIIIEKSKSL